MWQHVEQVKNWNVPQVALVQSQLNVYQDFLFLISSHF